MASMNRVFLIGNLTRDPEVRYIPSGKAVADLGLAVSRNYRTAGGEMKEDTCFVDITVWEKQAETAGKYLKKGSAVLVEGSLRLDQWEDSNGEKRSRLRVTADRLQFLDRAKRPVDGSERPAEPEAPRPPEAGDAKAGAADTGTTDHGTKKDEDNLPF